MRDLPADTVVDGRYQVIDRLGSGGMADVFCAQDLQLGRKVALKLLHDRFAEDEEFVERFRREASSAAGLQHQHVVAVYDRGDWDGTAYIAMEYVAGRTLKEVVDQEGPLEGARAVDITIQILRAARFAHRRGVIHRDLKPHNVIVDAEGRAKVTDFGIARAGASDMTQTGSIMGTAQYLSPEQAQGHAVHATSDLYAVGVVLYELLTGQVPFDGESAVTIAVKQVNEAPVPPSRVNPAVTPELEAVVLRALEKDPARRYADADEFIAALQDAGSRQRTVAAVAAVAGPPAGGAAAGGNIPPLPPTAATAYQAPGPPPREVEHERVYAPPPPARRRWWPWLAGLAALAAAGLVALLLLTGSEPVPVPNVVGSSISVASQTLEDAGFEVSAIRDNSDKPRNTVIGQNPSGSETAAKGSKVTITVSDGPAFAAVPDVVGKGRRAARKELQDAGFKVTERREFSGEVRVERVISQSPEGNAQAGQGSPVTITVSRGPERVAVPGVVGRSEDQARDALEAAGFRVTVRKEESEDEDPGTVLTQDPRGEAPRGSTVTLTVATEPKEVEVPDVVGRSQNTATETLSARGFEVDVEEAPVETLREDGIVMEQSPAEGRRERGSTVTITVGKFDPDLNPDPEPDQTPPTGGDGTTTTTPASP